MLRAKTLRWTVAAAVIACPLAAAAKVPAVVQQIPADAQVFITIPSLSGLSKKLSMLNQRLGLKQPQMNNVLGFVKAMSGIQHGIDDDGGAAIAITSLPLPSQGGARRGSTAQPKGILLLPVKNYGQFIGNFGPSASGSGPLNTISIMGTPLYARQAGSFAVISNDRQQVVSYTPPAGSAGIAARSGHFGQQVLTHSDISLGLNVAQFGPTFRPLLKQQLNQTVAAFRRMGPAAQMGDFMDAYLKIYGKILDGVLRDGSVLAMGIDLSSRGVGLSYVAQFKKNSKLAAMFAKNPAQAPALNRLPNRPYLMAMSVDTSTLPLDQWSRDIVAAVPSDTVWGRLFGSSQHVLNAAGDQWQTVIFAPNPGSRPGQFATNGVWVVSTSDPDGFIGAYEKFVGDLNGLDLGGLGYQTEFQRDARQVAERPVSQFKMRMKVSESLRRQMGPNQAMIQDQTGLLVPVDDAVVAAINVDDATLNQAIQAAGGQGQLDQNAGIALARKRLPKSHVGQMHFNVGALVQMIGQFTGMPVQGGQMSNLPPIAAAVSVQNGSIGARAHVPMSVITSVKNTFMAFAAGPMAARAR